MRHQNTLGRWIPGTFYIPLDTIVHGQLEAQREIEPLKVEMVYEAQVENCFVDLPPAGLVTRAFTRSQLEENSTLIYDARCQWMPFGGQHGIKGVQKFVEEYPHGKAHWDKLGQLQPFFLCLCFSAPHILLAILQVVIRLLAMR